MAATYSAIRCLVMYFGVAPRRRNQSRSAPLSPSDNSEGSGRDRAGAALSTSTAAFSGAAGAASSTAPAAAASILANSLTGICTTAPAGIRTVTNPSMLSIPSSMTHSRQLSSTLLC